ncbi:MAG: hypothetical protein WC822_04685 [Candidatus Paceibacterota bacterium]|jgi:archaellum component FlaC
MKKKIKTPKITIDKLAIMMNNSFEVLRTDIGGLKKDMGEVKEDIKGVKNRLEGVSKRIDDFAENKVSKINFKELGHRVSFIEEKLVIKNK